MFITEVVPAILYGFFVLFLPESPRYLVQIGKYEEAETVLRSVGTTKELKLMIEDIKASLSDHKPRFSDLLDSKRGLKPVVWVALAFAFLIQMTGINNVLLYATDLWTTVGFEGDLTVFIPVLTSIIGIIMTLIGMSVIDKVGRRPLLLWGAVGMFRVIYPKNLGQRK
ncbi:MFS transporter [Actinotignum urinale]|uniref:MFS transporter n=2 Tax=Actinotignum urinale TaxID=190146 RepID=A0AAW9HY70_9ACTO|nr:MFS transporter [Actinotignum urinale]MDY5151855.1 MFS transporter [Actinotignum urinale]MDY5155352.1 MFS transporter [Actinotignum urinale]WIK58849.1 MFS transporter [Actinotignum urinale]